MSKVITENEQCLVSHYMKEWEVFNQYTNDIEKHYSNFISVFIGIVTTIFTVVQLLVDFKNKNLSFLFYLFPIIFTVIFGYMSYQFRIVAILHGHLARIEDDINAILGEDIYLWHSALTESYMAHNNVANKGLMLPVSLFVLFSCWLCFKQTILSEFSVFNCLYWGVMVFIGIGIFLTFLNNDKVRWKSYHKELVAQKYLTYKTEALEKIDKKVFCKKGH